MGERRLRIKIKEGGKEAAAAFAGETRYVVIRTYSRYTENSLLSFCTKRARYHSGAAADAASKQSKAKQNARTTILDFFISSSSASSSSCL